MLIRFVPKTGLRLVALSVLVTMRENQNCTTPDHEIDREAWLAGRLVIIVCEVKECNYPEAPRWRESDSARTDGTPTIHLNKASASRYKMGN